jgi:hypothetical protein
MHDAIWKVLTHLMRVYSPNVEMVNSRKSISSILHGPDPIEPEDGPFSGPWLIAAN